MRRLAAVVLVLLAACGDDEPTTVAAEPGSCAAAEAFAADLDDIGITYDYDPSASPAALASGVHDVFAGRLTGGFSSEAPDERDGVTDAWLVYDVEVEEVAQGALAPGDVVKIGVPYNPAHREADSYASNAVAGIPVVVFGERFGGVPIDVAIGPEGLMTACDGGAPIGRVGGTDEWQAATSLDAVLAAAVVPVDRVRVTLWHCGIDALGYEGRVWEVPTGEEPFDATNAPETFAQEGAIERVGPDELRYTDDGGVVLRFVPDDGTDPPCA